MIQTGKELAAACEKVANDHKTLYVMGCFGAPMTASNKERYTKNHSYNQDATRKSMILNASADTFGFDCVCLIKGLLWGWDHDQNAVYGGAVYGSNGVPDIGTEQMIAVCKDVSSDFTKIAVGEMLWLQGHAGVYIGNGLAVECTPEWKNGVQITAVHNIGKKSGYNGRSWTKHGKLPYVTYEKETEEVKTEVKTEVKKEVKIPQLSKGSKGDSVKALQILLIGYGFSCGSYGADGDFGSSTEKAVKAYQADHRLEVDGVVGPATWAELLGV